MEASPSDGEGAGGKDIDGVDSSLRVEARLLRISSPGVRVFNGDSCGFEVCINYAA